MRLASENYRLESYMLSDAVKGSSRLLAALQEHHDFNLRPPKGWRPRVVKLDPPPLVQTEVASPRGPYKTWFSVEPDLTQQPPKLSHIAKTACRYFKVELVELYSQRRDARLVYARQIAFYLAKIRTSHSYPEIGRRYGNRDHTTVLHGVRKIGRLVKDDWRVCYDVAYVEAML